MQKVCANSWCGQSYEVTEEDLAFYEKVSPVFNGKKELIPQPTKCPDCRMQRRMLWRNELHVFLGESALTGKKTMTQFTPNAPYVVYAYEEWLSDAWDATDYGMISDPTQPFFSQFDAQLHRVPHPSRSVISNENCDYANATSWSKNCYMVGACSRNEDCSYCYNLSYCKDCMDCSFIYDCERCYSCIYCRQCTAVRYSKKCLDCSDSYFLLSCEHCSDCFGCANLFHKKYCFFNEQLTKEEYEARVSSIDLTNRENVVAMQKKSQEHWLHFPQKYMRGDMNENVTGNNISRSKNVRSCFDASELEDCAHCWTLHQSRDCQDCYGWGRTAELCYECTEVGDGSTNAVLSAKVYASHDILYSFSCYRCHHLFGCVSMKDASYCIFNTQYTKEEYDKKVPELIESMRIHGEWGEFFPMQIAPFAYNASAAIDYFPLTEDEAVALHIPWYKDENPPTALLPTSPTTAAEIQKTPAIFLCNATQVPFKIIEQELAFYTREGIPPPDVCFAERNRRRFRESDSHKLWNRTCAKCQKSITTSYSPDRPEIVYCEECYLKEVY